MKLAHSLDLLLLIFTAQSAAFVPSEFRDASLSKPQLRVPHQPREQPTESNLGKSQGPIEKPKQRAYKDSNDAPVDRLDGKPRVGPFVNTTPEPKTYKDGGDQAEKPKPKSMSRFKEPPSEIPEKNDSVMNDENRAGPKKGTTGTEGGVSERAKERKAKGNPENIPKSPVSPAVATGERGHGKETQQKPLMTDPTKEESQPGSDYGLLGKPAELSDAPRSVPQPRPRSPGSARKLSSDETKSGWLHETMPYTEDVGREPKTLWEGSGLPGSVEAVELHEWFHSFVLSFTMILVSEIGDKTFLVAALMAMRHDRLLVFSAAFGALIVMTVLSAVLGHAVPTLLPKRLTTFLAAILFLVFGARMLREGLAMPKDSGVGEEMQEVEAELEEKEQSMARRSSVSAATLEAGRGRKHSTANAPARTEPSPPSSRGGSPVPKDRLAGFTNLLSLVLSPAWVQTFVMTFLGEWGDRSQIATIAMAAGQDYWLVTLGAILGHACCTGVAVIGGRALAGRVSMRVVTIGGAVAFLVFGVIYIYECITEA